MSRIDELKEEIRNANEKLRERQRDMEYWIKEISSLTERLGQAQKEEIARASRKKAA